MLMRKKKDYQLHRFYCRCLTPGDCLDLVIDTFENKPTNFELSIANEGTAGFWKRLKYAFLHIFKKHKLYYTEVELSPDQAQSLGELLTKKEFD